jgi:hypothetical protein
MVVREVRTVMTVKKVVRRRPRSWNVRPSLGRRAAEVAWSCQ